MQKSYFVPFCPLRQGGRAASRTYLYNVSVWQGLQYVRAPAHLRDELRPRRRSDKASFALDGAYGRFDDFEILY